MLGICQGLEVISVIQGKDNIDTLDSIYAFGPRKIDWVENRESRFFNGFPIVSRNRWRSIEVACIFTSLPYRLTLTARRRALVKK